MHLTVYSVIDENLCGEDGPSYLRSMEAVCYKDGALDRVSCTKCLNIIYAIIEGASLQEARASQKEDRQ